MLRGHRDDVLLHRKHLRESLLFSSETGRDEGGRAETPDGHQETFCHHRAELFTKEAEEAETLKQSQIGYKVFNKVKLMYAGLLILAFLIAHPHQAHDM